MNDIAPRTFVVLPRNSACFSCRRRKIKCPGDKPSCHECLRSGRNCQYEDDAHEIRMQQLLNKIKELETKILKMEEQFASGINARQSRKSFPQGSSHMINSISESLTNSHAVAPVDPSIISPVPLLETDHVLIQLQKSAPSWLNSNGSREPSLDAYPSSDSISKLLSVFLLRREQCGFELHINRTIAKLQGNATETMVPALFNAVLLMACHFAEDDVLKSTWENIFLTRTRKTIEENIDKAYTSQVGYNPLHHLQAMVMLGQYYYIKGRLLEGHVHCSNATRVALTMNLHKINSRIFKEVPSASGRGLQSSNRIVWSPCDPIELGEAINLWWTCCALDFAGSVMNGLPPSLSRDDITTVWPCSLDNFEPGRTLPEDNYSVAALFDPQLFSIVADVSKDDSKSLVAKGFILAEFAGKLGMQIAADQNSDELWAQFESCDRTIIQYTHTMPPVDTSSDIQELSSFVLIHTTAYCSSVQLHSSLANLEITAGVQGDLRGIQPDGSLGGLSYARCIEACRGTILAATLIQDSDLTYMNIFIGLGWICAADLLAREASRLRASGFLQQAQQKEEQLALMERCMKRLITTYPLLTLQVRQIADLQR